MGLGVSIKRMASLEVVALCVCNSDGSQWHVSDTCGCFIMHFLLLVKCSGIGLDVCVH